MIQHYLKITFRNLVKYKLQSIISIMGLAVGIAFFIFSFYWLHYETSYDNFYPASNRTFLVCNQAETFDISFSRYVNIYPRVLSGSRRHNLLV